MTTTMMKKLTEAKKMMNYAAKQGHLEDGKFFIPAEYDDYRYKWQEATPAWATLKKYAEEIGLKSEQLSFEWHSDGSALAEMCGIEEGTLFYYTAYYFA